MLRLVVWGPRLLTQKIINGGAISTQRIVWRHEPAAAQRHSEDQATLVECMALRWGQRGTFTLTMCAEERCPPLPLTHSVHSPCMLSAYGDLKLPSVLLVIGEAVHQQPLLDELLPLGTLRLQVTVVVVGHDDAV